MRNKIALCVIFIFAIIGTETTSRRLGAQEETKEFKAIKADLITIRDAIQAQYPGKECILKDGNKMHSYEQTHSHFDESLFDGIHGIRHSERSKYGSWYSSNCDVRKGSDVYWYEKWKAEVCCIGGTIQKSGMMNTYYTCKVSRKSCYQELGTVNDYTDERHWCNRNCQHGQTYHRSTHSLCEKCPILATKIGETCVTSEECDGNGKGDDKSPGCYGRLGSTVLGICKTVPGGSYPVQSVKTGDECSASKECIDNKNDNTKSPGCYSSGGVRNARGTCLRGPLADCVGNVCAPHTECKSIADSYYRCYPKYGYKSNPKGDIIIITH